MKYVQRVLLSAIVVGSVGAVAAGAFSLIYQSSRPSTFQLTQDSNGSRVATSVLPQSFVFQHYGDNPALYLVESLLTRHDYLDAEGATGTLTMKARSGDHLQNVLWNVSEDATEVRMDGELGLMTTGLGGCCDASTGYRIYDIASGKLILSYNKFYADGTDYAHPLALQIPNSDLSTRYVGVIVPGSTRDADFKAPTAGMSAVALVKINALGGTYQKIQLEGPVDEGYMVTGVSMEKDPSVAGSERIEFNRDVATLWQADGSRSPGAVGGVLIVLKLEGMNGAGVVKIPVRGDRLVPSEAEIPHDVKVN